METDFLTVLVSCVGSGAVSGSVTVAVLKARIEFLNKLVDMVMTEIKDLKEDYGKRIIELEKKTFN